jgi:hypothetical protein
MPTAVKTVFVWPTKAFCRLLFGGLPTSGRAQVTSAIGGLACSCPTTVIVCGALRVTANPSAGVKKFGLSANGEPLLKAPSTWPWPSSTTTVSAWLLESWPTQMRLPVDGSRIMPSRLPWVETEAVTVAVNVASGVPSVR